MLAENTPLLNGEAGGRQQGLVTTSLNAPPAIRNTRETVKQRVLYITQR